MRAIAEPASAELRCDSGAVPESGAELAYGWRAYSLVGSFADAHAGDEMAKKLDWYYDRKG